MAGSAMTAPRPAASLSRPRKRKSDLAPARTRMSKAPEPAESQIIVGELIDALAEHLQDIHTFNSDDDAFFIAVWIIHVWLIEAFDHTMYLGILSHEPDTGKTELIRGIRRLCSGAMIVYPTLAGITRYYTSGNRVLIIDQIHNLTKSRKLDPQEFTAHLANGHTRDAGVAALAATDGKNEYRSTFGPKIFAGLTSWKTDDETASRMRRVIARPGTKVDAHERQRRINLKPATATARDLYNRLEQFATTELTGAVRADTENRTTIELNEPNAVLFNRDCDNWLALIAIADMAGDSYAKRMRDIAAEHCGGNAGTSSSDSEAEHVDELIMQACRNGILPVDGFLESNKPPLELALKKNILAVSDQDFGWSTKRQRTQPRGITNRLQAASLIVNSDTRKAELRMRPKTMRALCAAIGMGYSDVRRTYKKAGRLKLTNRGDDQTLSLYASTAQVMLTAIDFSAVVFGSGPEVSQ